MEASSAAEPPEIERLRGDLRVIGRRIGHDFRMHLAAIVSTADLLADVCAESNDPQNRFVDSVRHSVDEILALLDRVKAIVMTAEDGVPEYDAPVGDVAAAEAQRLTPQLEESGATLLQPVSWPPVWGVHSWLKVIWSVLLGNALQHGGCGVRIEIGWSRNGAWRFWVRDNGPGVAPESQAALFPPLHLASRPEAPHGTGLAIVRRLCHCMGGLCGFEPVASGGACFWFELPERSGEPYVRPG